MKLPVKGVRNTQQLARHEILPEPEQRRLLFMLHNHLQLIVSL